jgi:DNA-directed RNA polymerase delta subunit
VLRGLRRDRDRQIIARRFGFGLTKRHTLEQIGQDFGITRERVRQIEKATLTKLRAQTTPEIDQANRSLAEFLTSQGGISTASAVAEQFGASTPQQQSYITFLASLAPDIAVADEDDQLKLTFGLLPDFSAAKIKQLTAKLVEVVKQTGRPAELVQISEKLGQNLPDKTVYNLAMASKALTSHDELWGLVEWPEVNPKSIRDKTYLIMTKHKEPLHFGDIAERIRTSNFRRRNVTVQAVHNELIKDPRFVLIGRGIYALAEWGYTPGTVADIIIEVLRQESPLHKDEIIRRVLRKRQVKTTTIVLNLQEKEQFERVAKATYKLKKQ